MSDTGRPSEYNAEYHPARILELMAQGKLNCEICADLDISERTFIRWRKEYPEFGEAYEKGLSKCESELIIKPLKKMVEEGNDKGYKPLAHIARNKFGHDSQSYQQGAINTQININNMVVNNKEDYDKLEQQVKQTLIDLQFTDVEYKEVKDDRIRPDQEENT